MAWTFRKRKKLFPGVHLNYGSSGLSLNLGIPGASVTIGSKGVYANTGLPGTGIRSRKKLSSVTSTENTNDVQVTEKDIKRAGCVRNAIYFFGYLFSYALVGGLIAFTMYAIEEKIILLACIMGILAIFFFINTIRLHLYHRRGNDNSTYTFAIVISYLLLIVSLLCTFAFWFSDIKVGAVICTSYDVFLISNLYYCYKYRIRRPQPSTVTSTTSSTTSNQQETTYNGMTRREYIDDLKKRVEAKKADAQIEQINNESSKPKSFTPPESSILSKSSTEVIPQKPIIDYTKEGVLFFSDRRVLDELGRTYSPEFIKICAYVVYSEKCILSDIQVSTGLSYQKVLESVKILEKTRIVRTEGYRRKVIVTDETIAIRLLLRYAKEHNYDIS